MITGIYMLIGLIYAIINGSFRKINSDGDWFLVFIWIFIWPVCFTALIVQWLDNLIQNTTEKEWAERL